MAGLTPVLFAALVGLVPGPVVPPSAGGGAAAPVAPISPVSPGEGGVRPLVPGGMRGPWDAQPPPPTPPVTDICQLFLKGRDQDTRFVGKTTAYLSAGWVGGSPLGWFDQTQGGGPLTGIGVYRDWGKSTVRRVDHDGGCELDTRDKGPSSGCKAGGAPGSGLPTSAWRGAPRTWRVSPRSQRRAGRQSPGARDGH